MVTLYFLPHGPQIIPGLENPYNDDFRGLHSSMLKMQNELESEDPEVIILVTPHGYHLEDDFVIYIQDKFRADFHEIIPGTSIGPGERVKEMNWKGNGVLAQKLLDQFKHKKLPSQGLTHGVLSYPLTLSWGASVPLHYINNRSGPEIIIISVPRNRHNKIAQIQNQLEEVSNILISYVRNLSQRVVLIFSGDLSHVHTETGPYGYHESAILFDGLIQEWVKQPTNEDFKKILDLQPTALACGMAGISILQGIFNKTTPISEYDYYAVPTYFGMSVAKWRIKI